MTGTYSAIEDAIINRLIAAFPDELSETRTVAGNIDNLFQAIFEENKFFGVFLEFAGGRRQDRATFKGRLFVWSIYGIFTIRYNDDIEENLRDIIDRLASLFDDDHTVGGVSPLVELTMISEAEVGQINDVPFYWIPFMIEATVK